MKKIEIDYSETNKHEPAIDHKKGLFGMAKIQKRLLTTFEISAG